MVSSCALTSYIKILGPVTVHIYEVASKWMHKFNIMCTLLQLVRVVKMNDIINRQPVSVFFVLRKIWTKNCLCTEKMCMDKWIQMATWKIKLTGGLCVCLCCRCVERCSGTRPRSPNTN